MSFESRRGLVVVLFISLLTRVAWILVTNPGSVSFGDASDYLQAAQSFCSDQEYPVRSHLPFFRAPLYPLFLAVFTFCRMNLFVWIKLLQALVDTGSVWLVYLLAGMFAKHQRTALLAAAIASVYPPFIYTVKDIQTETLYTFLFLASVVFLFRSEREEGMKSLIFSGIFLGLAALTRPATPGFLLFLFLWFWIVNSFRAAVKRIFIILILFLLPILPWTIRNYHHYGEWIFISDASGYAFWKYNNETSWKMLTTNDLQEYKKLTYSLENTETDENYRMISRQWKKLRDQEKAWYQLAFDYIRKNKLGWLGAWLYKMAYFWRPWLNPFDYPFWTVVLSFVIFGAVYIMGVLGIVLLYKSHKNEVLFFILLFLFTTLVHSLFLPGIRYRICLVDPYMMVLGSAALSRLGMPFLKASTGSSKFPQGMRL
jgi:4-amino-4-deoxy-L-arabinose transferase-like glycosyltransferase